MEAYNETEKEKKNRNLQTSLIVFGVILFIILGIMFYLKKVMPSQAFGQGQKYLEAGQYEKALKMFDMASEANPYDDEPVYYKAVTLSKMPSTYQNQKLLYDIAQLDDCEKASEYAENILLNMRNALDKQIGGHYIDNVLYDGQLIRWNNDKPITFSISSNISVPNEYYDAFRQAFQNWQTGLNGQIQFKEVQHGGNISVVFADTMSFGYQEDENIVADSKPLTKDNKLLQVDVKINSYDKKGNAYTKEQLLPVAQHQIGHALGLWGHSADENDVMYYSGDYIVNNKQNIHPTNRDLNTLLLIYKMIPDVIDKELTQEQYKNMFYHYVLTSYPGKNFELETQRLISQIRENRQNVIAWVDLAINYAYKKQYERSNYILIRVLPVVSNDYRNQQVIFYNLAANYYKMKQYDISQRYLTYATNILDDIDTQILESFIDYRQGRKNIAEEKLVALNKQHPDNIEVAIKLAEIYGQKKDKNAEKQVIDKLVKNNPRAMRDRRVLKYKHNKQKFLSNK